MTHWISIREETMETKMDSILTVPQVAEYLQISKSKLYYLVQTNQIPHIRINRNVRIRESDLKAWLEKNTNKMDRWMRQI